MAVRLLATEIRQQPRWAQSLFLYGNNSITTPNILSNDQSLIDC